MVNEKTLKSFSRTLLILLFIIFPFGQLVSIQVIFFERLIRFQPIDLIAGLSVPLSIFVHNKTKVFQYMMTFLFVVSFGTLVSIYIFSIDLVLIGLFYLLRLYSYICLFSIFDYLVRKKVLSKNNLVSVFLTVLVGVAVMGWGQYLFFPDVRWLKSFGWDDHYYRLVGSFLDPTFTSILMVIGSIVSLEKYIRIKKVYPFILLIVFVVTVLFTYARAGYVALVAGFTFLLWKRYKKVLFAFFTLFAFGVLTLPRPGGWGVRLERVYSIESRIDNYIQTIAVYKGSPLLGVGYNNICLARQKYMNVGSLESHSCSGSDSSVLLVLATTGVVGFSTFLWLIARLYRSTKDNSYGRMFLASSIAVLVHSLFVNSLFYPWVLISVFTLMSISRSR